MTKCIFAAAVAAAPSACPVREPPPPGRSVSQSAPNRSFSSLVQRAAISTDASIPVSSIGTDTMVEYCARACKIHADATTPISDVSVSI